MRGRPTNCRSASGAKEKSLFNWPLAHIGDFAVEIEAQPGNDAGTEYGILFRYDPQQGSYYLFHRVAWRASMA